MSKEDYVTELKEYNLAYQERFYFQDSQLGILAVASFIIVTNVTCIVLCPNNDQDCTKIKSKGNK